MANPGTNTAIQALAKSGVTAHRKIEALQKQNADLVTKSNEMVASINQLTSALQKLAEFTRELMERIEAVEEVQEEQDDDAVQFVELLEEACQSVLDAQVGGDGVEIDPLPPAPPAYTSLAPLADDGGSSEPAPSASAAH